MPGLQKKSANSNTIKNSFPAFIKDILLLYRPFTNSSSKSYLPQWHGGCGCMSGGSGPNTHLHIFFAHKDATDNRWYFIDPYGIYSYPYCYPAAADAAISNGCNRYPVSWKGGNPFYAN